MSLVNKSKHLSLTSSITQTCQQRLFKVCQRLRAGTPAPLARRQRNVRRLRPSPPPPIEPRCRLCNASIYDTIHTLTLTLTLTLNLTLILLGVGLPYVTYVMQYALPDVPVPVWRLLVYLLSVTTD